jgi:alkyl sulfatase BDS1-like metallo-beta-lactamase superfamily hydrolase
VVELLNHLVFVDPSNQAARDLQADAMEQIGYQSESATFRNAFLTGAHELRNGTLPSRPNTHGGYLAAVTMPQLFDSLAVRLRSEDVGGVAVDVGFDVTDLDEQWTLGLAHRALHYRAGLPSENSAENSAATVAIVRLSRTNLIALATKDTTFAELITAGTASVKGDRAALDAIFDNLETFMTGFPIVEP